jgi:dTDP-glucose 4,6-dehydratase
MMRSPSALLVTGGAGFIGTNLIRYLFTQTAFSGILINYDKLTYAGNPENLADMAAKEKSRYVFVRGDICDGASVERVLRDYRVDVVVHLAAESHVDRSIHGPRAFIETNVMGTFALLEAARSAWGDRADVLFHHVSTDEVFGSLGPRGKFTEASPYAPRSPYSASKAASDHLVNAYHHTYGLPVTISNCSNNYGPYQFPEKLIPLMLRNMLEGKPLPVYGDGGQVRNWLFVEDHASALWKIVTEGRIGETYAIGGREDAKNLDTIRLLYQSLASLTGRPKEEYARLITYVKDRPGHDRRYSIDSRKIHRELGWAPATDFRNGMLKTVRWYLDNAAWVDRIVTGEYLKWVEKNYADR